MFNLMGMIFPNFPLAELYQIKFNGGAFLYSPSSYQLLGLDPFSGDAQIKIILKEVISTGLSYRMLSLVDYSIFGLILMFLFRNAKIFFDNLMKELKSGDNFNNENYLRIKRIGYWFAVFVIYRLVKGIFISHFLLKDVTILGEKLKLHPEYIEWSLVIFVLVIFAFAEIYKVAVSLKKESELTI